MRTLLLSMVVLAIISGQNVEAIRCYNATSMGFGGSDSLSENAIANDCTACSRTQADVTRPFPMTQLFWSCATNIQSSDCASSVTYAEAPGMIQNVCQCCSDLCNKDLGCAISGAPALPTSGAAPGGPPSNATAKERCSFVVSQAMSTVMSICYMMPDDSGAPSGN